MFIRLSKCFEDLGLLDHMMGFRPNLKTSNNLFVLKTLIDKQLRKNEKLFCCSISIRFGCSMEKRLHCKIKDIWHLW